MLSRENLVCGKTVIREILRSRVDIDTIYVSGKVKEESIGDILSEARKRDIVVKNVHSSQIDNMCETKVNQGLAAKLSNYSYLKFNDMLDIVNREKNPFILILDEIQDPQNLGAIIRNAEGMGVKNIVIPQKRSAQITDSVWKASMGALAHLNICRINNVKSVINLLKENGFKVLGTGTSSGSYINDLEYDFKVALIIGNEHKGIREEILNECDIKLKIPMFGNIDSFNASVASGITMYEIKNKQRR